MRAQRLNMNVYLHRVRARATREQGQVPDLLLEIGCLTVRFAQGQMLIDLQVHIDKNMAVKLMRGKVVYGESAPLRRRADRIENVLARLRSRFHVHHNVGGNDLAHSPLHLIADRVHLLEAGGARNADRDVHKMTITRPSHAHAFGAEHTVKFLDSLCHALLYTGWRRIQQCVCRAPAEARRYPNYHRGDSERGYRVRIAQPTLARSLPDPNQNKTDNHRGGAPHVGRKMQGICFERLAEMFS